MTKNNDTSENQAQCAIQNVVCSYPRKGDRVQIVNTHGEVNNKFGTVTNYDEVTLDNGSVCVLPDWEYQVLAIVIN